MLRGFCYPRFSTLILLLRVLFKVLIVLMCMFVYHWLSVQISLHVSQLLRREKDLEKLCEERDELKVKMECQSRECVHLNQTREGLEADLALSHEKLHTLHLEVHLSVSACVHVFVCRSYIRSKICN